MRNIFKDLLPKKGAEKPRKTGTDWPARRRAGTRLYTDPRSIKELLDEGCRLNKDIMDMVYSNPVIRDLPKTASLYGLYARFIVAKRDSLYIAVGTNKELIYSEFGWGADGFPVPLEWLDRIGYTGLDLNDGFLGLHCHVCALTVDGVPVGASQPLRFVMENVEKICCLYRHYEMEIPPYFYYRDSIPRIRESVSIVANRAMDGTGFKDEQKEKDVRMLKECALYDYPVTPDGKKPGKQAFVAVSRYMRDGLLDNPSALDDLYGHPERWDKELKVRREAYASRIVERVAHEGLYEYLEECLKDRGIPFYTEEDMADGDMKKAMKRQRKWQLFLEKNNPAYTAPKKSYKMYIYEADTGIYDYLEDLYADWLLTDEEFEYGCSLWHKNMEDIEGNAVYAFVVEDRYVEHFREFAEISGIKYGGINRFACEVAQPQVKGPLFVAEIQYMPRINMFLQILYNQYYYYHYPSVTRNGAGEARKYPLDPNEDYLYVTPNAGNDTALRAGKAFSGALTRPEEKTFRATAEYKEMKKEIDEKAKTWELDALSAMHNVEFPRADEKFTPGPVEPVHGVKTQKTVDKRNWPLVYPLTPENKARIAAGLPPFGMCGPQTKSRKLGPAGKTDSTDTTKKSTAGYPPAVVNPARTGSRDPAAIEEEKREKAAAAKKNPVKRPKPYVPDPSKSDRENYYAAAKQRLAEIQNDNRK